MTPDTDSTPAESRRDLRHFVRWYDNALPAPLCDGLVTGFQQMREAHVANGRGVRAGLERSAWTELNLSRLADPAMKGFFFSQMDSHLDRYNTEVGLGLPIPPSNRRPTWS